MSRETQYIGLTNDAEKWVKNALEVSHYEMTTGMFDEPVSGSIFILSPPAGPNEKLIAREVVQADPWSSGVMILTHLKITLVKKNKQEIDMGYYFSWVLNPNVSNEIDYKKGHYYV